ncbi:hypothetical protein JHK85_054109 [Glycine max]|nr:hypothetical protein JHK85_054109 [Glycine max]
MPKTNLAQSSDLLPNLKPNNSRLPQVRSRCSPSAPAPHVHCAHYFSNLHTLFSTSLLKQIMEKQTSEQSRRERRKESRLAKNASKHHPGYSTSYEKHGNDSDSELETKSKSDTSVSPSVKEAQVEKFESYSRKYETDEEYMLSEEERGGSVAKKKKKTKGSSKSSGKSMVEMGMQLVSIAAEKDLELERKLSKKLKVKEGKIEGSG